MIEIIRFTTHPDTSTEALQQALELLDRDSNTSEDSKHAPSIERLVPKTAGCSTTAG